MEIFYIQGKSNSLYKDTTDAWNRHLDFFDRVGDELVDIHSYGFSFSNVDLFYVEMIAGKLDVLKVTWYINKIDDELRKKGSRQGKRLDEQIKKVEVFYYEKII